MLHGWDLNYTAHAHMFARAGSVETALAHTFTDRDLYDLDDLAYVSWLGSVRCRLSPTFARVGAVGHDSCTRVRLRVIYMSRVVYTRLELCLRFCYFVLSNDNGDDDDL